MPLGTEVGLGPGDIVLDGDPTFPHGKGHSSPTFVPICSGTVAHLHVVASRLAQTATAELFLPAALRAAQTCRYLVYSEADFEVFRPAGATRCTDGGEIWHGGGDRRPNFTPIGETTRV